MDPPRLPSHVNGPRPTSMMVCDNCRRRKVRCNRGQPCLKCQDASLHCAYTSIPQKKGPKGHSARVLSSLRRIADNSSSFSTPMTVQPSRPVDTTSPVPSITYSDSFSSSDGRSELLSLLAHTTETPGNRLPGTILNIHVSLFLQHLYPVMPVVDPTTLHDSTDPESLDSRRYAFLVALSAATHLQLNLDIAELELVERSHARTGADFIAEAVRTLHEFDPLDCPHTETLLTMFFLFCAYGNLRKAGHAWHYLSQTIFFLQFMNLDKEVHYTILPQAEAETHRRIFWLVFITERAYALQTGRPVMLRANIRKPHVFDSDAPAMLYGLVSLASLFEQIPPEFYEWAIVNTNSSHDMSTINSSYQSILSASPLLLSELSETHQVDLVISQQWLQVRLWACFTKRPHTTSSLLPIQIPVTAGRCVLACLSSVSVPSVDAHGIGIEQKLYDIGTGIAELTSYLYLKASTGPEVVAAKDVLKGILDALRKTRGSESYLFSPLLERTQGLLGVNDISPTFFLSQTQEDFFPENTEMELATNTSGFHGTETSDDYVM